LIVVPTWLLMNSFADSVRGFVSGVQQNTLHIPPPREGIRSLPLVGQKLYDGWSKAQNDLPALIQSLQPKAGDLLRHGLSIVASIGRGMLLFLASFVVANILMAYGESAANSGHAFFTRVAGPTRGGALAKLSLSTIRAVALGVIGVAAIQSLLIGLALLLAGIPIAGVLAIIALVLGIAQVPALIITIPVIIYIWSSGNYSSGGRDRPYDYPVADGHRRQRPEAADARPRSRRANACHTARRTRRHGDGWHSGNVYRRDGVGSRIRTVPELDRHRAGFNSRTISFRGRLTVAIFRPSPAYRETQCRS
jgi:hypothetical protein